MKKLNKYTYVIDGVQATYDKTVADKAKKDGKNVLAVPVQYADVTNLEHDETSEQITLSMYSYEEMVEFAQKYGNEHAPELYKEWLKNKVVEATNEAKKYNDIMELAFNACFYAFEPDYDY